MTAKLKGTAKRFGLASTRMRSPNPSHGCSNSKLRGLLPTQAHSVHPVVELVGRLFLETTALPYAQWAQLAGKRVRQWARRRIYVLLERRTD